MGQPGRIGQGLFSPQETPHAVLTWPLFGGSRAACDRLVPTMAHLFHDRPPGGGLLLSAVAGDADRLDSRHDLGGLCAQPVQDRPQDRTRPQAASLVLYGDLDQDGAVLDAAWHLVCRFCRVPVMAVRLRCTGAISPLLGAITYGRVRAFRNHRGSAFFPAVLAPSVLARGSSRTG